MANDTLQKTSGRVREPAAVPPRPWARLGASVVGGVALHLAFPPTGLWFLAPVGVALLTLALYGVPVRRAAWLGYVGAVAFLLPTLAWVRPIGDDAWLALVAVESLFWAALAAGAALVMRMRWWPLWVGCLWVAQEWLRGIFPLGGFPWARLAFSQGRSPFTPFAALGGAPLVSFAVVLCGALLALAAVRVLVPEAAAGLRRPGWFPAALPGLDATRGPGAVPGVAAAPAPAGGDAVPAVGRAHV